MPIPHIEIVTGPPCPACNEPCGGILYETGLHRADIVQCWFCSARIFVGTDGYRQALAEDKAPPVKGSAMPPPSASELEAYLALKERLRAARQMRSEAEDKAAWWSQYEDRAHSDLIVYLVGRPGIMGRIRTVPPSKASGLSANVVESEQSRTVA